MKPTVQDLKVQIPGLYLPSFRTTLAKELGIHKKILISTSGGIGDQLCAEPTLRYALENFKDVEISLATMHPYFFTHLKFKKVIDLRLSNPRLDGHLILETLGSVNPLANEFMINSHTHCVDYASLSALRLQLPNSSKRIHLTTAEPEDVLTQSLLERDDLVVVHAGKHWASRTFPKDWWNAVLVEILKAGATPVLIGSDLNQQQGTVDVQVEGCIDLRNKMSLIETAAFLQRSKVLLTNDSGPLHIAATGDAWIGFIATSKHPDFITHWRKEGYSWRMENLGRGGIWEVVNSCPNQPTTPNVADIDEATLRSWLPEAKVYTQWAVSKLIYLTEDKSVESDSGYPSR